MLERVGRSAARHHWRFIVAWMVVLGGLAVGANKWGGELSDSFSIPGADSQKAVDLLTEEFPAASGATAIVVFEAPSGKTLSSEGYEQPLAETLTNVSKLSNVVSVAGPVGSQAAAFISTIMPNVGFANVQYDTGSQNLTNADFQALVGATDPALKAGLNVVYGGELVDAVGTPPSKDASLGVGLIAAMAVLLVGFGSVLMMFLPILNALVAFFGADRIVELLSDKLTISTLAPSLISMISIAVGIDYSLLVIARHRENLSEGMSVEDSVARTNATAGKTVVLAGSVVALSIAGLVVVEIPFIEMLGLCAAVGVAMAVLASTTLLPAVLGLAGKKINSWSIRKKSAGLAHSEEEVGKLLGARIGRTVVRHKWFAAVGGLAILCLMTVPFFDMKLGTPDDGTQPKSYTQRQAYDLMAEAFGPGTNGPLLVAVSLPSASDEAIVSKLEQALATTKGVSAATPAVYNADMTAAVITVIPDFKPDAPATEDLVREIRGTVVPQALSGTKVEAYVGGLTAETIDLGNTVAEKLPIFIAVVLFVSMLILLVAFRSFVIPVLSAVVILLVVGASYGVMVAVFQWGWARNLVGVDTSIPIMSVVPMLMFAILFGIAMDYQVFLLTRVREAHMRGESVDSIISGVARTNRVITCAALIMVSVFFSFVFNVNSTMKMFGLGLSAAVVLMAFLGRLVIVPATLAIFGRHTWRFPAKLDKFLPDVTIE